VAERKARNPGRGKARLEPPTRLADVQTANAGRSDGAVQLDELLSSFWVAADNGAGANACGTGGVDKAIGAGCMSGMAMSKRSIEGVELCTGTCASARFMLTGCAREDAGDAVQIWPSIFSAKQVDLDFLVLLVRFVALDVLAKDAHTSSAAIEALPKRRPSERWGDAPTDESTPTAVGGACTPDVIIPMPRETAWPASALDVTAKTLPQLSCIDTDKKIVAATATRAT